MEGKNWSILFENKTVNQNYSNFLSILNEACDKHIPTKTVVIRTDDKPFMNSSIRKAIRKRNRIHYRAKSTNNPDHWSQYRHLRNDVVMPPLFFTVANLHGNFTSKLIYILSVLNGSRW